MEFNVNFFIEGNLEKLLNEIISEDGPLFLHSQVGDCYMLYSRMSVNEVNGQIIMNSINNQFAYGEIGSPELETAVGRKMMPGSFHEFWQRETEIIGNNVLTCRKFDTQRQNFDELDMIFDFLNDRRFPFYTTISDKWSEVIYRVSNPWGKKVGINQNWESSFLNESSQSLYIN